MGEDRAFVGLSRHKETTALAIAKKTPGIPGASPWGQSHSGNRAVPLWPSIRLGSPMPAQRQSASPGWTSDHAVSNPRIICYLPLELCPGMSIRDLNRDTGLPLPPAERRTIRHGPVRTGPLQQADDQTDCLPQRQAEQDLQGKADLDRTLREGLRMGRSRDGHACRPPWRASSCRDPTGPRAPRRHGDALQAAPLGVRERVGDGNGRRISQQTGFRRVKPHHRYGQQRQRRC